MSGISKAEFALTMHVAISLSQLSLLFPKWQSSSLHSTLKFAWLKSIRCVSVITVWLFDSIKELECQEGKKNIYWR